MYIPRKVIIFLILILKLIFICESSEIKNYENLDMLPEDPLVSESMSFVREIYRNSSYIHNDKEICNFLSGNWKYENHNIFIEYIFATKNYVDSEINLYKIIINHNETESKSYKHDIEGAWKILLFEKMVPQKKLSLDEERAGQLNKIVDKWITKGGKYQLKNMNDISFFEKINKVEETNAYICHTSLVVKGSDAANNEINDEEYLILEDIPSGTMSISFVIHLNPNK